MPWQPTWTAPDGSVIQLQNKKPMVYFGRGNAQDLTRSIATYGDYNMALRDLDIAVTASEVLLSALNDDIVNRIDFPIKGLRDREEQEFGLWQYIFGGPPGIIGDLRDIEGLKAMEARMVAVLRNHRREAHLKANQLEAAEIDMLRMKELGFEAGPSLF